jgi:hypothetical protein
MLFCAAAAELNGGVVTVAAIVKAQPSVVAAVRV